MSDGPTNIDYVMSTAAALGVPMTEWQTRAYLGRGDELKAEETK